MYRERTGHHPPEIADARIWRYMDFAKFMALLHGSSLFFSRIDAMQDSHEGSIPKGQATKLINAFESLSKGDQTYLAKIDILRKQLGAEYYQRTRQSVFVNCWHLNEFESGAMWKVYGENAIAVQSTYKKLCNSFDPKSDVEINIGTVHYVDFETWGPGHSTISSVLCKRPLYDYERELRAVIYRVNSHESLESIPRGINARIMPKELIESVYVGPGRRRWFVELVRSMLNEYDLEEISMIRSGMDVEPMFA